MTQFTPGPWKPEMWTYEDSDTFKHMIANDTHAVAEVLDIYYDDKGIVWQEREANAKLIAAAPELLKALRLMIEEADEDVLNPSLTVAFKRGRAAISKATT